MDERTATPHLHAAHVPTLCDLSTLVPGVPGDTPLPDVERIFRETPDLRAIAVISAVGIGLLTRLRLETMLSGRLGYGRALLARAFAEDVAEYDAVYLDADKTLTDAASTLLAQPLSLREEVALVLYKDGAIHIASVAQIFREVGIAFREIAMRDPLTGLPNRRLLDEHGKALLAAGVDAERLAVLYLDLDGFKQVNDSLGHQAGDEVLVTFAHRIQAVVRHADVLGRLGGDEFAVLLADVDEHEAFHIADRIVEAAKEPFVVDGQTLHLSTSVGIAMGREVDSDSPLTELDALLNRADGAMLHAKRAGKARTGWYRQDQPHDSDRRARIRTRLHDALSGDTTEGLQLHYQPQLDLRTGEIDAVEALLRWTDDELGPVSPAEVIPLAEHTGQIRELGAWVLRTACAQVRAWQDAGCHWPVAINVSPLQLAAPGLVAEVLDAIKEAGISPTSIRIEVTESSPLVDEAVAIEQLAELQAAGVDVHLDDFGIGYSSLALLRRLPLTTLKIDRSIVAGVDSDEADAQLVSGVIQAAHTLGLTVVAEGVERDSQLERLRDLGCDTIQGYLISRPRPCAELDGFTVPPAEVRL